MKAGTEVRALTGLRGVAAIYVVIYHYFNSTTWQSTSQIFIGHGYLSVDIFFILSGFVMTLTYRHLFEAQQTLRNYLKFLGRRIARIYPLYFVTLLMAIVLALFGALSRPHNHFVVEVGLNLFMVQNWRSSGFSFNLPAWSLSTEWAAYLVFPILLGLCMFRSIAAAVLTALVCIGYLVFAAIFSHPAIGIPAAILDTHSVAKCVAEFTLGIIAFRTACSPKAGAAFRKGLLLPAILLSILALLFFPWTDIAVVLLIPPLLVGLAIGQGFPKRFLESTAAELAGRLSYSVYLTHFLFTGMVPPISRLFAAHQLSCGHAVGSAIAIALALALAIFFYHFVEIPGRNILRNWFEGGKTAPSHSEAPTPVGANS